MHRTSIFILLGLTFFLAAPTGASAAQAEIKDLSINGGIQDGKARITIEGQLAGFTTEKDKVLFASTIYHTIHLSRDRQTHTFATTFNILQGEPREFPLSIAGEGTIKNVTGENLQDWSVRQETNGTRTLVVRPRKTEKALSSFAVTIIGERELNAGPNPLQLMTLTPPQPALFNGYVVIDSTPEVNPQPANPTGLIPIEVRFLPDALRNKIKSDDTELLAFRFHGAGYTLPINILMADPEERRVVLRNFQLAGQLEGQSAAFTLTATARVKNPRGGSLVLLSGEVALAELERNPDWLLRFDNGQFILVFDKPGEFPLRIKFNAPIRSSNEWKIVDFRIAPGAVQPVIFRGVKEDTQFEFAGAARPERVGSDFKSFLPPHGAVKLAWKESRPEVEGKLFYSAEMLSQITISPGLMRQVAWLDFKVMQGELTRVVLLVRGEGSVTTVQGANVLAWNIEPGPNPTNRSLVVQFNQPQKETFSLQVQMQTELAAFPQAMEVMQIQPENATRFAGHFRVVNDGAVRLEVLQSAGLSQVSPEQFPETETTKAIMPVRGSQRFAFRFSSADLALRVQADNILPELSVSQLLVYHLGETEISIDGEFEMDIREAPLREVLLRVPKGYALARLNAAGVSDYFLREPADQPEAELRLVYGQPISDRHVVQLRLERNAALGQTNWNLPRIEVVKAKSTRGHIAVSTDAGFRITPERTAGLTDIATAFFPRKIAGIQAAFRLTEPAWEALMRVERLPQSIQADVFHLFSIGEGIAYGSSTMSFSISGAPISSFLISLSEEYFNVEFNGKDLRNNWQKTTNGYRVTLNSPVSGSYTLLATYERPFKAQGDTLTFTGARPLDAQSEQGHTLVVSAYQFQVKPVNVSAGLLPLETAEVPSEYRLFFDSPILAAYRYSARPFNLQLALSPLAQGETVSLVVDRAALTTRISKDGEVLTDARYFLKNRGNPHFRLALSEGTTLWSVTVNGVTVVPVKDGNSNLVPLPQRADPNSVQTLELKLASRSKTPGRVTISAPVVNAPVLLAEWNVEPDTGQRLKYRSGSLAPVGGRADPSGFAGLRRFFRENAVAVVQLGVALGLVLFALAAWRWGTREGVTRYSVRHLGGALVGIGAVILSIFLFSILLDQTLDDRQVTSRGLSFLAPVQQSGSALKVELANEKDAWHFWSALWMAWPALLGLIAWAYTLIRGNDWFRPFGIVIGWTLLAWGALRWPNGAGLFLLLLILFLLVQVIGPALRMVFRVPRKAVVPTDGGIAPATLALLFTLISLTSTQAATPTPSLPEERGRGGLGRGGFVRIPDADSSSPYPSPRSFVAKRGDLAPLAESVIQEIRVEEKFAIASAKIRWHATKNQMLPLLFEPAVMTRIQFPSNALNLVQSALGSKRAHQLLAQQDGSFDIELEYQVQVTKKERETGFSLPTHAGMVNRITLKLPDLNMEVFSSNAVSVQPEKSSTNNTVAILVLAPVAEAWIGWRPRTRDVKSETAVFFAELVQLYVPAAGAIEGVHQVLVRPAQGELSELIFDAPAGATITDVYEDGLSAEGGAKTQKPKSPLVSLWRFDPDTRKLRVTLNPAQSRPFSLMIRSQVPTGQLPFEQTVGLLILNQAAGQLGSLGIATGNEVQLDSITAESFSSINLEDFSPAPLLPLRAQFPGLTLRRAFRYSDPKASINLKASAVEPDIRVETQETLSLGEDRTLLAVKAGVAITRAGIFRLSFALPVGLDVESISGAPLSHWTELKGTEGRIITLHLKGKTEGQHEFSVSLSGPGTKGRTNLVVPRMIFREADKQRGHLVIVPEQGMRLQAATRDGVTQLDPQKSGIRQKDVLAFRLLHPQWALSLDLDQVSAWVQVTSLQHATVSESQVKVSANLQYQIENTGLKSLRVNIPTNAENVRFRGEQMADFLPVPGTVTNEMQTWEVKLHRRIIGKYFLQVSWQTALVGAPANVSLRGVQAIDANLQRGFVTVQSSGRLQVRAPAPPPALQSAEWQSIPKPLRQGIETASANFTFRLIESAYTLPLSLERHEAARLLPARVNNITLTSVISDEGVMLTQVKMELVPGDKRLLHLTLPNEARFWFAFVNQNGVWPWREQDRILIPLEQQSQADRPTTVELFYSSKIGQAGTRKLELAMAGPKFDLPLENITWHVYLNEKWRLKDWSGTLQLQEEARLGSPVSLDVKTYLDNEMSLKMQKTRTAEEMLQAGNTLLERGDPQQARRAFQSAYGLSTHDDAFNEDARVQLHNLKLQQALVGLNVRQSAVAGDGAMGSGNLRDLRNRKVISYTQREAKQIIDANTADDNAALMRLAERLVQQQDAALTAPTAIRVAIPEQGRLLTFRRTVQVDTWTDLRLKIEATAFRPASWRFRILILGGLVFAFGLFMWGAKKVEG